jgi:hypothetical protein
MPLSGFGLRCPSSIKVLLGVLIPECRLEVPDKSAIGSYCNGAVRFRAAGRSQKSLLMAPVG